MRGSLGRTALLLSATMLVLLAPTIFGHSVTLVDLYLIARRTSFLAIIALGVGFVISSGEIDLSSAGMVSFLGVWVIVLAQTDLSPALGFAGVFLVAACVGLAQGWLVAYRRASSLIITMGVSFLFSGAAIVGYNWLHEEAEVQRAEAMASSHSAVASAPFGASNEAAASEERPQLGTVLPDQWKWVGFREPWVWAAGAFGLSLLWRYRTLYAVKHLAIGLDVEASRLAGVNVSIVRLIAFTVSAAATALASVVWLIADGGGGWAASMGSGYELLAIAAAVLGGCRITGGSFQPTNIVIAQALLVAVRQFGFKIKVIPPEADMIVIGLLVLGAAVADGHSRTIARAASVFWRRQGASETAV